MFENSIEGTIIATAIALWFAHGWYLNTRLKEVHTKLDIVIENFNGLREYLYEIDPQFQDERLSRTDVFEDSHTFAGMDDLELLRRKESQGKRTLNTSFCQQRQQRSGPSKLKIDPLDEAPGETTGEHPPEAKL